MFAFVTAGCGETRTAAPFPEVDRGKLKITLVRSGCYGTCPDYKVTIDGRGHVVFSTREDALPGTAEAHREFNDFPHVVAPGKREYDVDPRAVDALLRKFRDTNFFGLKNEYLAGITDNPTYVLEIDTGHGRKKVVDYVGQEVGMPNAVTDLEKAVDEATQTARWVDGANGLVDALAREGFDFHSEKAARMFLQSIEGGGDRTLMEFVERGAPLDLESSGGSYGSKGDYGSVALLMSIREGRAPLFKLLADRGWLKRADLRHVSDAFVESGAGCRPELAAAAVEIGIPVDTTSSPTSEALMSDGGETALSSLANGYSCEEEVNRVRTASRLLELGADPNHRDDAGKTAIFGVENRDLLDLLLSKGADPKALDKKGASAVFDSWTDEIVVRLLQAGASPKGAFYEGKTLWEQMNERPMPKVNAWLASHPVELAQAKLK